MNNLDGAGETRVRFLPLLFGYRQKIKKLYLEPKLGIGELGGRILLISSSDYAKPSVTAIFGGMEAGLVLGRWSVAANFLGTHGISDSSAGPWHDKRLFYAGVSLGYTVCRKSKQ